MRLCACAAVAALCCAGGIGSARFSNGVRYHGRWHRDKQAPRSNDCKHALSVQVSPLGAHAIRALFWC
eukprot:1467140-Pleurochrysis_carterae.AAC.2